MTKEPSFLFFWDTLSASLRLGLFIILVSFDQSLCLSTTPPVKANGKTYVNCTQMPVSKICPPNWIKIDDPPMCLYHSYEFRNFADSREYCYSLGSNVDIVVTFNQKIGQDVMKSINDNGWNKVWMSYSDLNDSKIWEWSDGMFDLPDKGFLNFDGTELDPNDRWYKCAIYSTHNNKWVTWWCTQKSLVVCQMETQNGTCERSWAKLSHEYCIKPLHENKVFIDARKLCNNQDSHLLYIPDSAVEKAFKVYFAQLHTTWIGIQRSKKDKGSVWKWSTGTELSLGYPLWVNQQSPIATNKHCAILSSGGAWDSESCDVKLPVTCMRQWAKGPANTSMKVDFHRPDNVFFAGVPMRAACTFIGDEHTTMGWNIVNKSGVFNIDKSRINISTETLRSDDGFCRSRVTNTLVASDWSRMQYASLSCFAALGVRPNCPFASRALRLCDTKIFSVIVGPTGRPDLQLEYDGKSDVYEVEPGSSIIARCTVNAETNGTLQWILHLQNKATVLERDDERIVSYETGESEQEIKSELRIRLQESDSGTTISCFGYDVMKFNSGTSCREDNRFCSKSKQIKVHRKSDSTYSKWLIYAILGFLIACILIIAIWCIMCRKKAPKKLTCQQEEDAQDNIVTASEAPQDGSEIRELRSSGPRGSVSSSVDSKPLDVKSNVTITTSRSKKSEADKITIPSAENKESWCTIF